MHKVKQEAGRVVYRRGSRASWWFVVAMPVGFAIIYLLDDRDTMHYVLLGFMTMVMIFPAALDEHVVIDASTRTVVSSDTLFGKTTRSETVAFAQVTGVTVRQNYERQEKKRTLRPAGFAIGLEWGNSAGDGGIALDVIWEEADAVAEAEQLARILGTGVYLFGEDGLRKSKQPVSSH